MILEENQNPTACDNKSSVWKADSLNLGSKVIHQLNFSERDATHLTFEVKGGDIYPDAKGVDDSSMDNEFKVGDSCRKENLNELSNHASDQDICISSMDTFETQTNLCPDKSLLQSDLHTLTVPQEEVNLHVVKDICMDSGVQMEDKFPINSCDDDKKNCKTSEEGIAMQACISGRLKDLPLEHARVFDEVEYESKQESLIAQERLRLLTKSPCDTDIPRKSDLDGVDHQIDETNCGPLGKTITGDSKVDSIADRTFRHTISTSESGEKNVNQLLDQEASEVGTCKSLKELLEREPKEDKHASSILYDSKVESGSITFNFDSIAASLEQSEDDQNVSTTDNRLDSSHAEWSNSKETNNNNKTAESEGISGNTLTLDDDKNSANASVVNLLEHDDVGGESSFSAAASLIPNPASLSFRSDGSTASTKSFAFPILQSEWNSSPVRMAKADRRDFRKRRGWRSGLLCCRF